MKKFLKISICAFITLSMFCGCKADGALDDEKLSDFVNSENGSNEEKTGINCLSVYNSPSGNGIQLMFSNLPDGCNNVDIFYKPEDCSYWQRISTINISEKKQFSFPYVDSGKRYSFYVRFSHAEFGLEAIQLGCSNIVEITSRSGKGDVVIKQKSIKSKYENGIISFGKIEVENYEYISRVVLEPFTEDWVYLGRMEKDFDNEDELSFNLADNSGSFSYIEGNRYNINVYFELDNDVRLYLSHGFYKSNLGYGYESSNDYYTYK